MGEIPDAICRVCLNVWCSESLISIVADEQEIARRKRLYGIVGYEVFFGRYPRYEDKHDYTCRRVDELWNYRVDELWNANLYSSNL